MNIPYMISIKRQTRYNTDLRKYIGAFEISGSTWRVYHDAGHTDLNASSGALTHRYYVRDYLGSTRAVIDEDGNVLQSTAYYPSGMPLTPNSLTPQTIKLHTGKDFFDLQGAGWYDNQARYYDCLIPTFKSIDPLAEKYPWLSPYNHCANNPLKFVDPTGMFYDKTEAQKYASENYPGAATHQDKQSGQWFISLNENGDGPYTSGPVVTRDFGKINPYWMNNSGLNLGSNAFGIANDSKLTLINSALSEQSRSLKLYTTGAKALSTAAGTINIGYGAYNIYDYYKRGGENPLVYGKFTTDILVSGAMIFASGTIAPFAILGATIYFIADLSTDGFGIDYSTPKSEEEIKDYENENIN